MSSRTPEELIDAIDQGLAWRKKELSALRFAVEESPAAEQGFMIRAALALVYAHWEGYVKDTTTRYLKYVSMRRLTYAELAAPFAALGIRNEARRLVSAVGPREYISAYHTFLKLQEAPSDLPQEGVIDTGSNLNYSRFRRILTVLGIDCSPYDIREVMIDQRLLKHRNSIAHGEPCRPDLDDYDQLHTAVIDMLTELQGQVADAVSTRAYRCA